MRSTTCILIGHACFNTMVMIYRGLNTTRSFFPYMSETWLVHSYAKAAGNEYLQPEGHVRVNGLCDSLHRLNILWPARQDVMRIIPPAILMGIFWWALTDGEKHSWLLGVPVVMLAAAASVRFKSHELWKWHLPGLAKFFPVFVWQSIRAGFQVASLAFHPRCPLTPRLLTYHLRLPDEPSRIFFTNTMSLSPGSFSADLEEDRLTIHVLDEQFIDKEEWQYMESLIADLYGVRLSAGLPVQDERHE